MTELKRGDTMLLGRTTAGIALLGRSGCGNVELAYDDDRAPVTWWVGANWSGHRVFSEKYPYPAQAVEDLLAKTLNGGTCGKCGKTTVVGMLAGGALCCFVLTADDLDDASAYKYVRTCETAGA